MISFSVLNCRMGFCLCQHLGHKLSNINPYASDNLTNRGKSTHWRPFDVQYFIRVSDMRPIIKQMNGWNATQNVQSETQPGPLNGRLKWCLCVTTSCQTTLLTPFLWVLLSISDAHLHIHTADTENYTAVTMWFA